ncbi:MAG: hypothetical protein ACTS3F_14730, partial [Phycisphaerales bacterium]
PRALKDSIALSRPTQHALAAALIPLTTLLLSIPIGYPGTADPFAGPRALIQHAWWIAMAIVLWLLWAPIAQSLIPARTPPAPGAKRARRALAAATLIAALIALAATAAYAGLILNGALFLPATGALAIGAIASALARKPFRPAHQPIRTLRRATTILPIDWTRAALATLLLAPPTALLLVAAAIPPGTLWGSEANAYDVLSYHLQLPREWQSLGIARTLEHNAYSALPLYAEAAYTTLAAGFSRTLQQPNPSAITLAAGWHAACALITAWLLARTIAALNTRRRNHLPKPNSSLAPTIAAAAYLSIPWVIVTASLAYNEHIVNLTFAAACALIILSSDRLTPARRAAIPIKPIPLAILIGFLSAIATGAKPSAFFMTIPPILILLALAHPPRRLIPILFTAAIAGLITLAPWLIRNWIQLGNPVFPYATSIFGNSLWTDEQLTRWMSAHAPDAPLTARLSHLISARGLSHPQWDMFPILTAILAIPAALRPATRPLALALTASLIAQLIAWLLIGHQQSRFLLTIAIPGTLLIALACIHPPQPPHANTNSNATTNTTPHRRWPAAIAIVGIAIAIIQCFAVYLVQNRPLDEHRQPTPGLGQPARALALGVHTITGRALFPQLDTLTNPDERAAAYTQLGPLITINHALIHTPARAARNTNQPPPNLTLLLIGDATPLYYLSAPHFTLRYATTWSPHPLAEALRAHRDAPDPTRAALAQLRDEHNITHLLINTSELARLRESGYLDPALTPDTIANIIAPPPSAPPPIYQPIFVWNNGRTILLEATPHPP